MENQNYDFKLKIFAFEQKNIQNGSLTQNVINDNLNISSKILNK